MIANYFKLHAKFLKRQIVDAGFPALILFPAIICLYLSLYYLVKSFPPWGTYLLIIVNFQYLFYLSDFKRNDFLKTIFPINAYYKIRILENILISFGTFILLIVNNHYMLALLLLGCCILFMFTSTTSVWKRSIPTPFTKKPFEFIIGFRQTWLLLVLFYAVGIIAVTADNPNLILFCLFCTCLCCMFYYQTPEPVLIHWNQNRKASNFLRYKIGRGIIQLTLLLVPLLLLFGIGYPDQLYQACIVWLLGLILITFIITLKYAVFPRTMNVTEATIVGLCVIFYPLILAVIPYYYFKALHNLKNLL